MKKLILFLSVLLLISCVEMSKESEKSVLIEKRKTDRLLDDLIKNNSNYKENNIVREKMVISLDEKIDSVFKLNYFDDIPMKILRLGKNKHGKGALVHFYTDNYERGNDIRISDRLNFDVIAFMDESKASLLNEDERYYVSGKMLKRLSETEVYLIVPQIYFSSKTEINRDTYDSHSFKFNIGNFLMEVDNAIPTSYTHLSE